MTPTNSHLVKLSTRLEKGTKDYKTELGLSHSHSWTQGIGSSTLSGRTLALVVFKASMSETFPEAPVIGVETGGYPRCKSGDDFSRDARREEEARNPVVVDIAKLHNAPYSDEGIVILWKGCCLVLHKVDSPSAHEPSHCSSSGENDDMPGKEETACKKTRHCDHWDSHMPPQRTSFCTIGETVTKRCNRIFLKLVIASLEEPKFLMLLPSLCIATAPCYFDN